ncbi:MAG: insulinase family protein [Chitinophagales bacterium]|nr:insulinase family protein [Chitinophagales bacterium]
MNKYLFFKNIIILALFCLIAVKSVLADSGIKELNVDGLTVIIKHTPKEVISARFFIAGGTANYPLDKQGIESAALNTALNGGTTSMNKTQFKTAAEKIGTRFDYSASLDYSQMSMTCIKSFWDKSWALFADAIINPAFDPNEFGLILDQMVSNAKQSEENPDAALARLANGFAFKGKNYEKDPDGTSESLSGLTVDLTKSYYKNTIGKTRCFLVIVGNLTEEEITAKVRASLSKLPGGTSAKLEQRYLITKGSENIVERDIATNYLCGIMSSASLNSPDGIPMMMAMSTMYDRFFVELRTKRSLSYAPAAFINTDAMISPYSQIYISTDSPKKSIQVMVELLNDIKKVGFKEDELINKKEGFLTNYLIQLETSAQQSMAIGKWNVRGNWKMYDEFVERVNKTTLKDLNRVMDQNTNAIVWTYLGKKTDIKPEDFKQTEVYKNKPY